MAWYHSAEEREALKLKDGGSVNKTSAKIVRSIVESQPRVIKEASDNWKADPGILSALGIVGSPFEAMGRYAGDNTLEATGSPALATAAYLGGSGMFGTAPLTGGLKAAKKVGLEGLRMVDAGISHGSGPLAGLQHFAPGVMKREGGNWFPGEVEKQVDVLLNRNRGISGEIKDWIRGPMKNYIQKRFASPNDEIRKLYDQDIYVSPPPRQVPQRQIAEWDRNRKFADPAVPKNLMSETMAGSDWEQRADNLLLPDSAIVDIAARNRNMPARLIDYTPEERIGSETAKLLRRTESADLLPSELQDIVTARKRGVPKGDAGTLARFVKENPSVLEQAAQLRGNFGYSARTSKGLINALTDSYDHLRTNPDAEYLGRRFKFGNDVRYDPFSKSPTLANIRALEVSPIMDYDNVDWISKVPEDNPINAFGKRNFGGDSRVTRSSSNVAELPEFQHILDVMEQDLGAGRLTPAQLKSGSFSVDAAARRAHAYNQAAIKAMEEARQVEAAGFPTIKQYDSGHKWLELKHADEAATRRALQEEGNAMGHCVGGPGYCDNVLAGTKRIVSLRDPKGQSRATIELARVPVAGSGNTNAEAWRIAQIKGPANRKPGAAEIPLIQDFVKNNGPWHGDIGDFQNTNFANTASVRMRLLSYDPVTSPFMGKKAAEGASDRRRAAADMLQKSGFLTEDELITNLQKLDLTPAEFKYLTD